MHNGGSGFQNALCFEHRACVNMRTLADVYLVCLVQLFIIFLGDGVQEVVHLSLHDDGLLGGARWVRIYIVLF